MKAVEIPTDPVDGIDLHYLEKAIREFDIKACVFIPNFNNPLGSCMPDAKKKALVDLVTSFRIPLIEDDIYGELYFGKHRPRTFKSYDSEGWVMHCSSLSKSLAPGYRIGWCIPGRFAEQVKICKQVDTISGTTLTQVAMAHFLGIGRYEYHLKKLRSALHKQCLRYVQGIIDFFPEEVRLSRPTGGFVLWVEMSKKVNAYILYQEAMKYGISIAPGQIFSTSGDFRHCIRLSYGHEWDADIEYGLKVLGGLVRKQMG